MKYQAVLMVVVVLLMPIAYTIVSFSVPELVFILIFTQGVRYNITNELIIGACFIPTGLGNLSTLSYILLFTFAELGVKLVRH